MNRDQKAAVIDRLAGQLESAEAVFAIDYRGLSVKQAVDLRTSLTEADATFQVAKNTLTERAADKAGAEQLKPLLEGPTALTFVNGDVAVAAKAIADVPAPEQRARVQGRPARRRGAVDRPDRVDRQAARARRALRPVRGRGRVADHRARARA